MTSNIGVQIVTIEQFNSNYGSILHRF